MTVGRRCRFSLQAFCKTYNLDAFHRGWSSDQLKVIARIEEAVLQGALYAFALPRGGGKTTICRMACLWAISYGHCRYVFIIGANDSKAKENLDAIKVFIRFLPEYAADFPEIAFPVRKLEGISNRAGGQLCEGEPTLITWNNDRVVLPTVSPPTNRPDDWPGCRGRSVTSGSIISVSGLTGDGIRGSLHTLTTGQMVRPDFVLLDDPQTDESARSASQNEVREKLIAGAVLGMAGPGAAISAVQHAMNLYCRSPRVFFAEYRNDSLREESSDVALLSADEIAAKANGIPAGTIPVGGNHLTMFIDVQANLLFFVVCAWEQDLTGNVIDYGASAIDSDAVPIDKSLSMFRMQMCPRV